jgi:hypothetical protein
MSKIDKLIYFSKDGFIINKQIIDDYTIESNINHLNFSKLNDRSIFILSDKLNIPIDYDLCYIIERPNDKDKLSKLRLSCIFKPLFDISYDGMKRVIVDPELDIYYRRYEIYGLKLKKNGKGEYEYFMLNF